MNNAPVKTFTAKDLYKKRKAFVERIVVFIVVLENTELRKIQNQLL